MNAAFIIGTGSMETPGGSPPLLAKHATLTKWTGKLPVPSAFAADAALFTHILQFVLQPAPQEPPRAPEAESWNSAVRPRNFTPADFAPPAFMSRDRSITGSPGPFSGDPDVIARALIRSMLHAGRAGDARGTGQPVPSSPLAVEDFEASPDGTDVARKTDEKLVESVELGGGDGPQQIPGLVPNWTNPVIPEPAVVDTPGERDRKTQAGKGMEIATAPAVRAAAGIALAFAARISAKNAGVAGARPTVPDARPHPTVAATDAAGAANTALATSSGGRRHQEPEDSREACANATAEDAPAPQASMPWMGAETESRVSGLHASPRATRESAAPPRTEESSSVASTEAPRNGAIQNGLMLRVVAPDSSLVDVHVRHRMGEVLVAVRTPDPVLQVSLRRDLPELAQALDHAGFDAALITPAARAAGMENESQSGADHGHGQTQRQGQDHFQEGSGQRERERLFAAWLEHLED